MSDYISEDAVVQFLKYLPVESLLRFRCVCKGWKQLIDSSPFLNDHLAVQTPRLIVEFGESAEYLIVDPHTSPPSINTLKHPIEFRKDAFRMISIIGTLHGVVVCLIEKKRHLLIWNPAIRKSFTLTLPDDFQWDIEDDMCDCYGFWIDLLTKEFKIIILLFRIHPKEGGYVINGLLYSSVLNDWSVIPEGELGKWVSCRESAAVTIDGMGHWIVQEHDSMVKAIMSFDFKQECFEFIEMTGLKYTGCEVEPCCWQGKLSLLCWDEKFPHRCELYSRQEGNAWDNIFGFDLFAPTPMVRVFWPLEDNEGRGGFIATIRHMDRNIEDELVLYDAKTGCMPLKSELLNCFLVNMSYNFVESLLFP